MQSLEGRKKGNDAESVDPALSRYPDVLKALRALCDPMSAPDGPTLSTEEMAKVLAVDPDARNAAYHYVGETLARDREAAHALRSRLAWAIIDEMEKLIPG